MRKALFSTAAILTFGVCASTTAMAAPWGGTLSNTFETGQSGALIKVHSARRVHDMLHSYGYDRVTLVRQHTDYDGKPIYVFQACDGKKRYRIRLNWYGEVMNKRRRGWCFRNWY